MKPKVKLLYIKYNDSDLIKLHGKVSCLLTKAIIHLNQVLYVQWHTIVSSVQKDLF